jgi:hypothetical protein
MIGLDLFSFGRQRGGILLIVYHIMESKRSIQKVTYAGGLRYRQSGAKVSPQEMEDCRQEFKPSQQEMEACRQEFKPSQQEMKDCRQEFKLSPQEMNVCRFGGSLSPQEMELRQQSGRVPLLGGKLRQQSGKASLLGMKLPLRGVSHSFLGNILSFLSRKVSLLAIFEKLQYKIELIHRVFMLKKKAYGRLHSVERCCI